MDAETSTIFAGVKIVNIVKISRFFITSIFINEFCEQVQVDDQNVLS